MGEFFFVEGKGYSDLMRKTELWLVEKWEKLIEGVNENAGEPTPVLFTKFYRQCELRFVTKEKKSNLDNLRERVAKKLGLILSGIYPEMTETKQVLDFNTAATNAVKRIFERKLHFCKEKIIYIESFHRTVCGHPHCMKFLTILVVNLTLLRKNRWKVFDTDPRISAKFKTIQERGVFDITSLSDNHKETCINAILAYLERESLAQQPQLLTASSSQGHELVAPDQTPTVTLLSFSVQDEAEEWIETKMDELCNHHEPAECTPLTYFVGAFLLSTLKATSGSQIAKMSSYIVRIVKYKNLTEWQTGELFRKIAEEDDHSEPLSQLNFDVAAKTIFTELAQETGWCPNQLIKRREALKKEDRWLACSHPSCLKALTLLLFNSNYFRCLVNSVFKELAIHHILRLGLLDLTEYQGFSRNASSHFSNAVQTMVVPLDKRPSVINDIDNHWAPDQKKQRRSAKFQEMKLLCNRLLPVVPSGNDFHSTMSKILHAVISCNVNDLNSASSSSK